MLGRIKALLASERKSGDGYEVLTGNPLPTAASVSVSAESAMRCSTVYGCVKAIAETVQQIPWHLYRRQGDDRIRATDHPAYPLVTKAANDWTPASEFRLILATHLATHGNAYAFANRNRAGQVVEMIPLDPRRVSVRQHPTTLAPIYAVTTGDGTRDYGRDEILHIRGLGLDVTHGDSPVTLAREAIGLALTLESHCAGLFGRGAKPSGLLKHTKKVGDDVLARLRNSFSAWYTGTANSGRTMILEDGMEFEQLQLSSTDSQTLEMRRMQVAEVSRYWRVPLSLLNDLERVTHANAETLGQQFLTYCMMPILRAFCDAAAITLLTPEERDQYYFEFLIDDLTRAEIAKRFEAYSRAINAGVLNPNEARAMENRPAYAGGETFMRPVNTAPAPAAASTTDGSGADGTA